MSFFKHNVENINELIFEKRNKAYGAYALRTAYSSTLAKASFISLSGLSLLVFMIVMLNRGKGLEKLTYTDANLEVKPWETVIQYNVQPEKPKVTASRPPVEAAAPKGTAMATTVIDDPIVEPTTKPATNETMTNGGQGDANSQGTGTGSVSTHGDPGPDGGTGGSELGNASEAPTVAPEEDPEYEGGIEALRRFLAANIVYPQNAKAAGVEGTVYVNFVIDEQGNVSKVNILRGIGAGCDQEAVRVVSKLPRWKKPGKNHGHPVKVMFNIPIVFKLR